jgi:hypothetical protein
VSYKIGQISYSKDNQYLEDALSISLSTNTYRLLGQNISDLTLLLSEMDEDENITYNTFEENAYYLKVGIIKKDYEQIFNLKLIDNNYNPYNLNTGNYQNLSEKKYTVPILSAEDNEELYYIELIFTPNMSGVYTKIIFELDRADLSDSTAKIETSIANIDLQLIKNLIPNNIDIKEIGIQGNPGLIFEINGEGFHLGKTGTFTLEEEDFIYKSIGFCCNTNNNSPNIKDIYFILDYKYEEK